MSSSIVVIGASLGGVRALRIALSGVTRSLNASMLFVQHRRGGYEDRLAAMLAPDIDLDIREIDSHQPLVDGALFVAPPDYHVLVDRGRLELTTDAPVNHARPSIDVAFESAAHAYGRSLLAILLTGASADGARGLAIARGEGATTLVQDPDQAESPIAPTAAIELDPAHCVVKLEAIPAAIGAWMRKLVA